MKARIVRRPRLLVATLESSGGVLKEVYGPELLVVWLSKNGLDVEYDGSRVATAYRRVDAVTWERVDVPTLASLIEREPGVRFWTKCSPPNYEDELDDGWEVVK